MRSVYTEVYQTMLANLKQARTGAKMTQVEVAKRMRRPQSWVCNCESGERRVDAVELLEFARLYKRPLAFFIPLQ